MQGVRRCTVRVRGESEMTDGQRPLSACDEIVVVQLVVVTCDGALDLGAVDLCEPSALHRG